MSTLDWAMIQMYTKNNRNAGFFPLMEASSCVSVLWPLSHYLIVKAFQISTAPYLTRLPHNYHVFHSAAFLHPAMSSTALHRPDSPSFPQPLSVSTYSQWSSHIPVVHERLPPPRPPTYPTTTTDIQHKHRCSQADFPLPPTLCTPYPIHPSIHPSTYLH